MYRHPAKFKALFSPRKQTIVYNWTARLRSVLVEYVPTFCCVNEIVLRSQFSSFTLLQHPPMHSSSCCYAFGRPGAAFMGGNHWRSLGKKQDRPLQTDSCCCWRRLLGCLSQCH